MNKFSASIVFYLATAGATLHLAAGYLYFFQAPLYEKIKVRAIQKLEERLPYLEKIRSNMETKFDLDAEISLNFDSWSPQENIPDLPAGKRIYSENFATLQDAATSLTDGATLFIQSGIYREAMIITANNVNIIGINHTVLESASAQDKAAIVITGDNNQVINIECRLISVPDNNGACVRLEGTNLQLNNVYFHSSQQGLLTGYTPGQIEIRNSRFEKLGKHGRAHGIYIGGGELNIENSLFIAAKDQGHEIKSRAQINTIRNSIITSMSSNNSRLIDISNGGTLTVSGTLLHQGPKSVNADVIGFSLESKPPINSSVRLEHNTIIMERQGPNQLLHAPQNFSNISITDNLIIGKDIANLEEQNLVFHSRPEAGLPDYPALLKQPVRTH